MTSEQIALVQKSFKRIIPLKEDVARIFYIRLFELDPHLKPLYKACDMEDHYKNLLAMLSIVISGLHNFESFMEPVKTFGQSRGDYQVKAKDYKTVEKALIWTLQQCLDKEFTSDIEEAWLLVYDLLASIMKSTDSKAA